MMFETKYDIGQVFYLPRSKKLHRTDEKVIDGITYTAKIAYFEPEVIPVVIEEIIVNVSNKRLNDVQYMTSQINPETMEVLNSYKLYLNEDELSRAASTYDRARMIAEEFAVHKKREYHG